MGKNFKSLIYKNACSLGYILDPSDSSSGQRDSKPFVRAPRVALLNLQ